MKSYDSTPSAGNRHPLAAAIIGLTAVVAILGGTTSEAVASTSDTCVKSKPTISWKPAVTRASAALTKTLNNLQNHKYDKAATHLRVVGHQTRIAHTAATALIGRPPTDPESDELPGVAAVQRVAALEHGISVKLLPPFHNLTRADTVRSLGKKLNLAVACRDVMLAKVIALKAGARDDYSDGLADTLPGYDQELTAMSTTLAGSDLTSAGRNAITKAQQVVTATRAEMQRVFGGGERSPGLPR
jgi:hypothetical protein